MLIMTGSLTEKAGRGKSEDLVRPGRKSL